MRNIIFYLFMLISVALSAQTLEKTQAIAVYDVVPTVAPCQYCSERVFVRSDETEYYWDGDSWEPWYNLGGYQTTLSEDSILVSTLFGIEINRDTIRTSGSGSGGAADGVPIQAVYDPENKILTTTVSAPGNNYNTDLSELANLSEVTKYHDFVITGQSRVVVSNPEGPYPILYEGPRALVWNKTTDQWEQTSATNNATNNGGGNSMQWTLQQRWALDYPTDTVRYMWSATSSRDVGCWTLADNDQSGVGTNNECITNFMNELDDMPATYYVRAVFVAQGESDGNNDPNWLQKWAQILTYMRTHPKIDDNAIMIFSPFIRPPIMTNTPWRALDSLANNTADVSGLPMYVSEERLDNAARDVGTTNHPTNYGYYLSGNALYDKYKSLTYRPLTRLEELIDVPFKNFINPAQDGHGLFYNATTGNIELVAGNSGGGGTDDQTASEVPITAIAQLPASTEVQGALTELAVNADVLSQIVTALNTLSGISALGVNLGTFAGGYLDANLTIKQALQNLSDSIQLDTPTLDEVLAEGNDANAQNINNLNRLYFTDTSLNGDTWGIREFSNDLRIESNNGTGGRYNFSRDVDAILGSNSVIRRKDIDNLGNEPYRIVDINGINITILDSRTITSIYVEVSASATDDGILDIPDPVAELNGRMVFLYNVDNSGTFNNSVGSLGNSNAIINPSGNPVSLYELTPNERVILICQEVSTGVYSWVLSTVNEQGSGGGSTAWSDITGRPTAFPSDWNLDIDLNGFGINTQLFKLTLNNPVALDLFDPASTAINHGDIQVFLNESAGGLITLNAPSGYTLDGLPFLTINSGEGYWLQVDSINLDYTIVAEKGTSGGGSAATPLHGIAIIDGDANNQTVTITPGIDLNGTQSIIVSIPEAVSGVYDNAERLTSFTIDETANTFTISTRAGLESGEVMRFHWVIY